MSTRSCPTTEPWAAFDARLEEPEWLPVLTGKAPATIVDELDRLLEGIEVDVPHSRILVLEVQVVGSGVALVVLAGRLNHMLISSTHFPPVRQEGIASLPKILQRFSCSLRQTFRSIDTVGNTLSQLTNLMQA